MGTSLASGRVDNGRGTLSAISGSGVFNEGVTLSAGFISDDPDGNGTITAYQWFLNNIAITGATASTYNTSATGFGTYKAQVTYTDGQGFSSTVTSADQAVGKVDNGQGTLSAISGSGVFNEGVTLSAGFISDDPDGNGTITAYQWFLNNNAISGATASTYNTSATGFGTYKAQVTYTDGQGFSSTVTSADQAVGKVDNGQGTLSAISGIGVFNEGVTLSAGFISDDPDGNGTITAYQWFLNNIAITGATASTYNTSATGFGSYKVALAYTKGQDFSSTVTSADQTVAKVNNGLANFSISGTPAVGNSLTATNTIADPDGNGSFSYSWQTSSNGSSWAAVGASSSYTVASNDEGKQIRVIITYNDGQGFVESFTSSAQSVARINKQPTGRPTLSGTFKAGQVITIDHTPIQDPDNFTGYTPTYNYSWETSSDGTDWIKLTTTDASDNNSTYTLTTGEVDKYIRGVVSYEDGYDTIERLNSDASARIEALFKPDTTPPALQSATATSNQLTLVFSEKIQIAGSGSINPGSITINADGQTRKITSSRITGSQLELSLSGLSLNNASSISISYNPPANAINQGFITDQAGNKLDAITNRTVDTFSTFSSINSRGLANAYKDLILRGTESTTGYGNARNNTITGNEGNNILDGLEGADSMLGGLGDDTYVVDNVGDQITELAFAGTDTVQSNITYILGENLENLTLIGSGSINGTGNSANNTITGNSAANILNGNGGADTLAGGRGNDTYIVDSADVTIRETGTSIDIDLVQASVSWILGDNLENLTLTGTSSINGTGNERNNTIRGNSANNLLDGGQGGTDFLTGFGGADTFRFSKRPTSFRSNAADHITDFSSAHGDKIEITKSAFGITASTATLSVVSGDTALNTALSEATLFVYNTANGELHWNQNGVTRGAGSGGVLAILDNRATLSAGDLMLA